MSPVSLNFIVLRYTENYSQLLLINSSCLPVTVVAVGGI
jgi:hypothetical protein